MKQPTPPQPPNPNPTRADSRPRPAKAKDGSDFGYAACAEGQSRNHLQDIQYQTWLLNSVVDWYAGWDCRKRDQQDWPDCPPVVPAQGYAGDAAPKEKDEEETANPNP